MAMKLRVPDHDANQFYVQRRALCVAQCKVPRSMAKRPLIPFPENAHIIEFTPPVILFVALVDTIH